MRGNPFPEGRAPSFPCGAGRDYRGTQHYWSRRHRGFGHEKIADAARKAVSTRQRLGILANLATGGSDGEQ